MVAPFTFFRNDGSKLNVYNKLKTLTEMGYHIRLYTFPHGETREIKEVEYRRVRKIPGLGEAPIGVSINKVIYNLLLLRSLRHDLEETVESPLYIHAHEIDGTFVTLLARRMVDSMDLPVAYDMHSILSERFEDELAWYPKWPVKKAERFVYSEADLILPISPLFENRIFEISEKVDNSKIKFVPDVPVLEEEKVKNKIYGKIKEKAVGKPIVLYMGTLDWYQGIDILLEAQNYAKKDYQLLIVGEFEKKKMKKYQKKAKRFNSEIRLIREPKIENMASYLNAANILVSPRRRGTNIPFKLYPYMRMGKPIVATDIPAHAILEGEKDSILCDTSPSEIAEGIDRLLTNQDLAKEIGKKGREKYKEKFSRKAYIKRLREAINFISE